VVIACPAHRLKGDIDTVIRIRVWVTEKRNWASVKANEVFAKGHCCETLNEA
jgi:hypothetical protein